MAITIHEGIGHSLFQGIRAAYFGGSAVQLLNARGAPLVETTPEVVPVIMQQPSILPATATIGESITLNLGSAVGSPAPAVNWDFTLNGASIRSQLDAGELTLELAAAGTYALTVSWTNSAGTAAALTAQHVVTAPPAVTINYDTKALAYFNADTAYAGTAADVTSLSTRGTGSYIFIKTGTGTGVQRTADGFVFGDGAYLQSQTLSGQPTTDGLFAVVDITLTSYGSNIGQIIDGTGGHVKLRNSAGTLQATGVDDTAINLVLGPQTYGTRMVIAAQIDDLADLLSGYDASGNLVSAPHAGLTDPSPSRFSFGRYLRGTIHRLAIVGRAEGQAWPLTMQQVLEDFRKGA